jgi:anti-sigma28 factor (negative regulator of flagellin synthesis)
MNVYEKLLKVQSELKAPKSQYNLFGKYHYRSCEDIQEAVKPILKAVKATLVVGDEMVLIGDRYYVKATATFADCESNGTVVNTAYAREEAAKKGMDSSQITGSASSYARKYALNGLFCIDDVKDSDSTNTGDKKTSANRNSTQSATSRSSQASNVPISEQEMDAAAANTAKQKIGSAKIATIQKELDRTGVSTEAICGRYKFKALADCTEGLFPRVMNALKCTKSKEAAQ